jgi:integrase
MRWEGMAELTTNPSPDCVFGTKAGSKSCKLPSKEDTGISSQIPLCPKCGTRKVWRDGIRSQMFGLPIQRWLCRNCSFRFSDPEDVARAKKAFEDVQTIESKSIKSASDYTINRQICVNDVKETKTLAAEKQIVSTIPQINQVDPKSAIVDFLWQLKRKNYSEDTIKPYGYNLNAIVKLGINLFDPQSFIDKMTELGDTKTNIRKLNLRKAYKSFLNYHKIEAIIPRYKYKRPIPYVPSEKFLDQLIASCQSEQLLVFLLTLKETGARPGEAFQIEWNDIDITNKTINISHPEKGSNPRILPISDNLVKKLLELPHVKANFIFNYKNKKNLSNSFRTMRDRAIQKLSNPELRKIDFYTFRYWRATEEYDRSHKDFEAVMYLLGHNSLRYVLLYKQLSKIRHFGRGEQYIVREAKTKKDCIALLADGFEHVMDKGGASLFRKLK